ncbi:MAG: DUF2322 family protein [Novosphingobium sp.]|uniref:DUF2322 family protein n=1 Tax=Novosphingobium sp. TaxID=1874826 RepID=UPI003B996236
MAKIEPGASFKDNLAQLPSIEGVARIDLIDAGGAVVASIPNEAGKQGSLAVYQYLGQCFGAVTPDAAEHGLAVFGEHSADAKARPGAHPNIDRLLEVIATGQALTISTVSNQ